jgi:hypothetical protein
MTATKGGGMIMTTITLEVPDELAAQLKLDAAVVPQLLREVVAAKWDKLREASKPLAPGQPIYQDIMDFLSSSPTLQQVKDFKISRAAQERLEDLLYKNREEELTADEKAELDTYRHLNHLVVRLKSRAISGKPFISLE